MNDIEAVWNVIEQHKNENKTNNGNTKSSEANSNGKENKRKLEENCSDSANKKAKTDLKDCANGKETDCLINDVTEEKFSFQQKILEILQKKGNISLKKLEKKVVNSYVKYMGDIKDKEKVIKKINKKLKKVQGIKLEDDNVSLISNS